jgi:hypothetical protein
MSVKKLLQLMLLAALLLPGAAGQVRAGRAIPSPALPMEWAQTDQYVATLEPIQGVVQHQTAQDDPQNPSAWRTLNTIIPVAEGDRIRTAQGGRAYLTFFEGIEVEIDANTLLVVSTLLIPQGEQTTLTLTLDVLVGQVIVDAGELLSEGDRLEVYTPGATSAVRGTRWWVIVTPSGDAVFAVERGAVEIIPHERAAVILSDSTAELATKEPGETSDVPAPSPGPDENPPAAAAAFEPDLELSPGMGLLLDRYGEVIDEQQDITFPDPRPRAAELPLAAPGCGDGLCAADEDVTLCAVDCLDQLTLALCGNGICDPDQQEDLLTCAPDCGPWAGDQCGNGTCDPVESGLTCAADCAADDYFDPVDPALCGNAACETPESALSCPQDCVRLINAPAPNNNGSLPIPASVCGDGQCSGSETPTTCPADCGPVPANTAEPPGPPNTPEPGDDDGGNDDESGDDLGADPDDD